MKSGDYNARALLDGRVVTTDDFSAIVRRLTEYGKVLVIADSGDYLRCGDQLTDALDACEHTFYRYTVSGEQSFRAYAPVFSMPEDVRGVLAVGAKALPCARYFCTVRDLPFAFLPLAPDAEDAFLPQMRLGESGEEKPYPARLPDYVAITPLVYQASRGEIAAAYGRMISKFIALTDYRVRCLCTARAMDKQAYDEARGALTDVLQLTSETPKRQQIEVLLSASLRFAALYAAQGEDGPCYGAERDVATLLSVGEYGDRALLAAIKLVGIYRLILQYGGADAPVPDFSLRLSRAAELSGISEKTLLQRAAIAHPQHHEKRKKLLSHYAGAFGEELQKMQGLLPIIRQIYRSYGGKDFKKYDGKLTAAVKYAPELAVRYHALVFCRDAGLLEKLGEQP